MDKYSSEDLKFVLLPNETECAYCVTPVCAPGPGDK